MEWNTVERAIKVETDTRTKWKGVGKLGWFMSKTYTVTSPPRGDVPAGTSILVVVVVVFVVVVVVVLVVVVVFGKAIGLFHFPLPPLLLCFPPFWKMTSCLNNTLSLASIASNNDVGSKSYAVYGQDSTDGPIKNGWNKFHCVFLITIRLAFSSG